VTGAAVRKRNEWGEGMDVLLGLGVFTTLHRGVKVISIFAIHSDTRSQYKDASLSLFFPHPRRNHLNGIPVRGASVALLIYARS
jgi:hypothetical protein